MSNEVMVAQDNQIIDFKAKATEWLQNMGTQLPPAQTSQFLELCQAYKLNPFKREIYAVGYGNKFNIIVGYEVYLKRAERTGKLNGWKCVTNEDNTKAKVTIYRKDWQYPFEHEVILSEVKQNSPIWQKMQTFMMKKVCIEQGFRLCFPDEMGGMPYGEEEVPYDRIIQPNVEQTAPTTLRNVTPVEEKVVTPEPSAEVVEAEIIDDRQQLKNIIEKYEAEMTSSEQRPTPYEQCCEALAENDPAKISNMLTRTVAYLGRKGIQVA